MQDFHHGFQNTQARYILVHAIAQCPINLIMISENKARLKEAWDTRSLFADLVERAVEVHELALDAGRPVNDGKIMVEVNHVIYHTGQVSRRIISPSFWENQKL